MPNLTKKGKCDNMTNIKYTHLRVRVETHEILQKLAKSKNKPMIQVMHDLAEKELAEEAGEETLLTTASPTVYPAPLDWQAHWDKD